MAITREQIRAAIGHLGISQTELAESINMERSGISKFLNSKQSEVHLSTLNKIRTYFDNRGIVFTENNGIAERPTNDVIALEGRDGFAILMDDVYGTLKAEGGEVCVSNVDERNWIKWHTAEKNKEYVNNIRDLQRPYTYKIFVQEGDDFFIASDYAEYRYVPREFFTDQSFYVYGQKLALITFENDDVKINVINNSSWAASFRALFNYAWSAAAPARVV